MSRYQAYRRAQRVSRIPRTRRRATHPSEVWTRELRSLQLETYTVYYAMKDPRVPWFAKAVAAGAVAYQASPIQIIPNWVPVLGLADNFLALAVAAWLVRRLTRPSVLAECRARAEGALRHHAQLLGGRSAKIMAGLVALLWLLAGAAITLLIARAL